MVEGYLTVSLARLLLSILVSSGYVATPAVLSTPARRQQHPYYCWCCRKTKRHERKPQSRLLDCEILVTLSPQIRRELSISTQLLKLNKYICISVLFVVEDACFLINYNTLPYSVSNGCLKKRVWASDNMNELLSAWQACLFVYQPPRDCFVPHSVGDRAADSSKAAGAWGWVISSVVQGQDRRSPGNTWIIKSD